MKNKRKSSSSLAMQLVFVVTLATGAAALLLSIMYSFGARQFERHFIQEFVVERVSDLLQDLDKQSDWENGQTFRGRHRRGIRATIDKFSSVMEQDMTTDDKTYTRDIAQELSLNGKELRFRLLRSTEVQNDTSNMSHNTSRWGHSPMGMRMDQNNGRTKALVSLKINTDQWINIQVYSPFPFDRSPKRTGLLFVVLAIGGMFILLGVLLTIRNITKPMRALAEAAEKIGVGEQVAPLPDKGPKEIRETIVAFNDMYARLNAFIEDRTGMLAAISHDLRTPLTALRLRAEMLDDGEEKEAIQRIVDNMVQMVEATLDFSRDDVTREETRVVDIAALVSGVVGDFQDMGHNIALAPDFPDHVVSSCRSVAMIRAVTNLIRNAVFYGKNVTVGLEESADTLIINVDDDGPGIPETNMEEVFKPFVRLDEARDVGGGSGLGLSIVNSIARAHGGKVLLINRSEGGLRAQIILPIVRAKTKKPEQDSK